MTYAERLRLRFATLDPQVDDLFLLEAHQIDELPVRAPAAALAAVLHADARLRRHLVVRHPPIEPFLTGLLALHPPVSPGQLDSSREELLWELADWIVYQRAPELLDGDVDPEALAAAIAGLVDVRDRTVIDAGAGTGAVSLVVAPVAGSVLAVEPVASLRTFLRARAERAGLRNLFVVDGFLHAIPQPDASADVLITRRAIGWRLDEERREVERVVRPGGTALHLVGTPATAAPDDVLHRELTASGHRYVTYDDGSGPMRAYLELFGR